MTYLKKSTILLVLLLSWKVSALTYLGFNGNVSRVSYDPMAQYNVKPLGTGIGYMLGFRSGFAGIEFAYTGVGAKGKIKHDGVENYIQHDQKTYTAMLNLYLNPRLYFKFGYGIYKIDHTLETSVSDAKFDSITDIYGLKNSSKGGLAYGIAFDLFKKNRGFNLYTAIDRYNFDKEGTTTTVQFGFKYLFDLGFKSIFTR